MEKELKYWVDLWEKQEKGRHKQQEFWDNRADFFDGKVFTEGKIGSNVVKLLKSKNMLSKDMKVLDIGCGPGKHTLPMAKEVKSITALDISENMLKHLQKNMESTNILNIHPISLDWKDVDLKGRQWEKAFDLVFASMTPGVFNYETLEKMLMACRKYCYLSGFVRRSDRLENEIADYIYEKYQLSPKKIDKVYYVFNILWQLDYTPEIEYIHRKWEDDMTVEEAYSLYTDKMSSMVSLSEEDREKIKKILEHKSHKGKVTEKTEVIQGILTWKCPPYSYPSKKL
ncbi:class I SAM-dependent methyltransferase [Isachenkonia alkalipeptolytica]|uniref:Class I SAM-dependent methyltransferase n=1 Tax=Isachenkonia alkalipeptolytica TaxID=2565777 RepID=A0AA43XIW9_9CLOT|nr:class I SAM-dependent methyltransferase [Isachenkonia alkalipeptolytica]NBG87111.1 class I SAM-dependent methyltransferase [Isachenkonia alkalipeptolytica]